MRQTFTVAAIAAALAFIPVTTAFAETPPNDLNDVVVPDDRAAENQVSTWCVEGVKYDNLSGQTFTIPEPPADSTWTMLVLNGGQDGAPENNVRSYVVEPVPAVGVVVTRPGASVSNAILCYEPAPTPAPTPDLAPDSDVSAAGPVPQTAVSETAPAAASPSAASPSAGSPSAASALAVSPAAGAVSVAPTQLPATGASSWALVLAALASLVGGLGLVQLSRRTS
jgi:LPXTG-motif cell wall-anchored protein